MNILLNKKYHEKDIFYNKEIIAEISKHRNIKTLIINNNPIFIYKFKCFNLKIKAYIPELDAMLINRIFKLCKDNNAPSLELIANDKNQSIEKLSNKISESYDATYVIDLKKDLEDLFSNVKDSRRSIIRKAKKMGVSITFDFDEEVFNKWWSLYLETVRRGNFIPERKELIWSLLLKNHCDLFTAWENNKLLAGAIIVTNNYPVYWLGGSSKEYPEYHASSLLQWRIIEHCKKKDYEIYDMGGASLQKNHGPTIFKKSFGGELIKTIHYTTIFKPITDKFLSYLKYIYYKKLRKSSF
ncbi:lipid II:glycine glycyltransferase FemX [Acidobacteriota bacterium]